MSRQNLTITLDPALRALAKDANINISRFVEDALKTLLVNQKGKDTDVEEIIKKLDILNEQITSILKEKMVLEIQLKKIKMDNLSSYDKSTMMMRGLNNAGWLR